MKRSIEQRAKFSHGGIFHQDQTINDMLVVHPQMSSEILKTFPLRYERSNQRFWLMIFKYQMKYNYLFRNIKEIIPSLLQRYKKYQHRRMIRQVLNDTRKSLNS